MLQPTTTLLPRLRQSNPSILLTGGTGSGTKLVVVRNNSVGGGGGEEVVGLDERNGICFVSRNRTSWIKGLVALRGGDPQKKDGNSLSSSRSSSPTKPLKSSAILLGLGQKIWTLESWFIIWKRGGKSRKTEALILYISDLRDEKSKRDWSFCTYRKKNSPTLTVAVGRWKNYQKQALPRRLPPTSLLPRKQREV